VKGKLVAPVKPEKAKDADVADPGVVEEIKAEEKTKKTGKYGTQPVKPYNKEAQEESQTPEKKTSWIALKVVDPEGAPIPGEPYEVTLPDGRVAKGSTDGQGKAKVQGFEPGQCKIVFPQLDKTVVAPK
jgi:uncharacterized protein (DUF2345 family)